MKIIENVDNVDVTINELITNYSLNRNFIKLLDNDKKLSKVFIEKLSNVKIITKFVQNIKYKIGQYVWFQTIYNDEPMLFLLQSIIDNNDNTPVLEIIDNKISFEKTGWKDKNSFVTMFSTLVTGYIKKYIDSKLLPSHEISSEYHPYGVIKNEDDLNKVILKKDFSNIDINRFSNYFPYETGPLLPDNTISYGYYRKWDCGLLEYNICFTLGRDSTDSNVVKCNNVSILADSTDSEFENNNKRYFRKESDKTIFNVTNSTKEVTLNGIKQTNRDSIVNSYFSTINFPIPFVDLNYMIFNSQCVIQQRNTTLKTIDSGVNSLVFINKTKRSISPLYVMKSYMTADGEKSGLLVNTFQCNIIGRWK